MSSGADVIVVGAGPAGTATAISSALHGLAVTLVERQRFPRHRPGETLHPGVEPVLRQLGVEEEVATASALRHPGISVTWAGPETMRPFGDDDGEPWLGYQVSRAKLDAILLARARQLGVEVLQPAVAETPLVEEGRVVGARIAAEPLQARFVVDAAGVAGWARRRLSLALEVASVPLRAHYGYSTGPFQSDVPHLVGDERGWTWTAPIGPQTVHWTRLLFAGGAMAAERPAALAEWAPIGRDRCADVTWRLVSESAGPGYFLVGEAAAVLDPASSHGVLRALMSGMLAAHTAFGIISGALPERAAIERFQAATASWFHHDARRLSDLYRALDPSWTGVGALKPTRAAKRLSEHQERRATRRTRWEGQ